MCVEGPLLVGWAPSLAFDSEGRTKNFASFVILVSKAELGPQSHVSAHGHRFKVSSVVESIQDLRVGPSAFVENDIKMSNLGKP